jgi:hypothetical protein
MGSQVVGKRSEDEDVDKILILVLKINVMYNERMRRRILSFFKAVQLFE